ncbi:TIGR02611 family protein [Gordonia paraffinivorans]|uniref:TIGR02611 family protein n=1 Tax=Gordonia paraffinivorans TaxID=175628 RepID=UPI000D60BF91|nr:TIGR02611 family protein [Gordonia paraffinivorans]MBY4572330.1 TIGR02611 family protein [Gordonia paraffinivorans]PWD43134.1 TIGR02611 family protein [Gordonia paraffinivorans]
MATSPTDTSRAGDTRPSRSRWHRVRVHARHRRYIVRSSPRWYPVYRVAVAVVGTVVLACGIVAIPYPGPGWLIVFLGLGILASEFAWAHGLLTFVRRQYDRWMDWISRQHWSVQSIFWIGTCAVVLVTLWLLNAIYTVAGWVDLDHLEWLASPIFS